MLRTSITAASVLLACLLLGLGAFLPFDTTDVPPWSIRIVDQHGSPVQGVQVRQYWKNYTLQLEPGGNTEDKESNADGYVQFERRTSRSTLFGRFVWGALGIVRKLFHGSTGVSASVTVLQSLETLDYNGEWSRADTVVLKR